LYTKTVNYAQSELVVMMQISSLSWQWCFKSRSSELWCHVVVVGY